MPGLTVLYFFKGIKKILAAVIFDTDYKINSSIVFIGYCSLMGLHPLKITARFLSRIKE